MRETNPDELIGLIVGRSTFELFHKSDSASGPARVVVRGLKTPGAGPVDFDIREGELLGLVGLRGAGQEEIGRALFGAMPHDGSILIDGEAPDLSSPRAAVRAGVGLLARDRAEESIASALSVRENAYLNPSASGRGLLSFLAPARRGAQERGARRHGRPSPECAGIADRGAVGRQSAEGRRRPLARDGTPAARRRGPDSRSRRRRESGDLPADRRARSRRNSRSWWCRPTSRRLRISAIGRSSSTAAASSPNLAGAELTTESVIAAASASEAA